MFSRANVSGALVRVILMSNNLNKIEDCKQKLFVYLDRKGIESIEKVLCVLNIFVWLPVYEFVYCTSVWRGKPIFKNDFCI